MDEWMVWRREGRREAAREGQGGAAPPPDAPLGRRATPTASRSGTPLSPRGQRCPSGLCSQPPAAFSGGGGQTLVPSCVCWCGSCCPRVSARGADDQNHLFHKLAEDRVC